MVMKGGEDKGEVKILLTGLLSILIKQKRTLYRYRIHSDTV